MASRNGVLPAVFSHFDVRLKSNPKRQYRVKYLGKGDKLVVCTTPMHHCLKDAKKHQPSITAICLNNKQQKSFTKSKTVLGVSLYSLSSFNFTCKPVLDNLIHQFMSEIEKSVQPLDWLNDQIKDAELGVRPWQLVLFALNPLLAKLWSGLSVEDKWDFSLKYKSMFMTYYAAMPLQSAYKLRDMVKAGQLVVMRDVQPVKYENGVYRLSNGEGLDFQTKYLFNAMGPGSSVTNVPLYADLITSGLVTLTHLVALMWMNQPCK
uniref:Uncharacterized protein n=1 Tax=Ditylenchus dipsaci TaxID=166011 RepID=A0A915E818_9BILA